MDQIVTIQNINPDDSSLASVRISSKAAEKIHSNRGSEEKPVAETRKDDADVSDLSRTMAEFSQGLEKDLQVRPDKVQLARTKLEQGFEITNQNIDAIWDRMIQNI